MSTELFELVFSEIRDNVSSVNVYPSYVSDKNVKNRVVVRNVETVTDTVMFSSDFSRSSVFTMVISCIHEDTEQLNLLVDEVISIIENNNFGSYSVVDINTVIDNRVINDNAYHSISIAVQFRL